MNRIPRYTVLIPAHNARETIARALRSVLGQTFTDYELIVVDDGSTDGTADVVACFADPRIMLVRQTASGTPAGSRNAGLAVARGEFIAFLDADDVWYPEKLLQVDDILSGAPHIDVVCHAVALLRGGRTVGERRYSLEPDDVYQQLLYRGNFLTTSATTVRRKVLDAARGFRADIDHPVAEDLELWIRLAKEGARFLMIDATLGGYEVGSGVSSVNLIRSFRNTFSVLDPHYEMLAREGLLDVRRALWRRVRARLGLARDLANRGSLISAAAQTLGLVVDLPKRAWRYRQLQ